MKTSSALSHRERVRLALDHRPTDRVPIAMVCSGINAPADRETDAYLRRERHTTLQEYLHPLIDISHVGARYVGPPSENDADFWGVRRRPVSYGLSSYYEIEEHPLAPARTIDDLARFRWPSADWFDYSSVPEQIAALDAKEEHCLMFGTIIPFEQSWYLRGFQQTFTDLALNPEMFDYVIGRVAGFCLGFVRRMLEAGGGRIDLVFTGDDLGSQKGLLMSLAMWERHIKPHHRRINALVHEFGAKVIYHSDGAVMDAVPGLLDAGIDVLQALQFDAAGMDPRVLKERFGDRLCFEGGVSVQHTLPFGTVEDVRAEVRERIGVLGRNGGYILGPAHAIQAGTPPENIVALFDTAAAYGPTPADPDVDDENK